MVDPINVLIVDDNPIDAELEAAELESSNVRAVVVVARDEAELRHALTTFDADVVLCDFSLPGFDGFQAVAVMREYHPTVPVIFVSGTISEEHAVLALHCGAVDYVLKTNLVRLPTAVRRAVADARESKRLRGSATVAELAGSRNTERFHALWNIANDSPLTGAAMIESMLTVAAAAVGAPQPFGAVISHEINNDVIVLYTTHQDVDGRGRVPDVGSRTSIESTLARRAERTSTWDDLTAVASAPGIMTKLGWRSALTTRFRVGDATYYLTFGSLEPITRPFATATIEYVELVAAAFGNRLRLAEIETTLIESETGLRFQAERLERLWDIAGTTEQLDSEAWLPLLREAAVSIRPGLTFRAWFGRVDGADIVQEAIVEPPEFEAPAWEYVRVGERIPLAGTMVEKLVVAGGGTRAVNDMNSDALEENSLARSRGWRALLATAFSSGPTTYTLVLVHSEPASPAFGLLDHIYLKMLASSFARHVHQRRYAEA